MLLKQFVSPVYWNLIPEVLSLEIPEEKYATCNDCHLCQNPSEPKSLTKCCDYYPTTPNYMVGAILSDETGKFEEGKRRIKDIISKKAGITPNGIIQPLSYVNDVKRISKSGVNPKNKEDAISLKCPYYDNGNCSIYAYRTEICSTYFCHSVSGKVGQVFWKNFVSLLRSVENKLAIYVMREMSYDFKNYKTRFSTADKLNIETEKGVIDEYRYQQLWQKWSGKEEEFYIQTFDLIQQIDKDDVFNFLGLEDKIKIEKCKNLSKDMNDCVIPDLLKFNTGAIINKDENGIYFIEESSVNKGISDIELMMFRLFDGKRSTYEVIRKATLLRLNFSARIPRWIKIGILSEPSLVK